MVALRALARAAAAGQAAGGLRAVSAGVHNGAGVPARGGAVPCTPTSSHAIYHID